MQQKEKHIIKRIPLFTLIALLAFFTGCLQDYPELNPLSILVLIGGNGNEDPDQPEIPEDPEPVRPFISSVSPGNSTANQDDQIFEFTFNEAVESATCSFAGTMPAAGTITWNGDSTAFNLSPNATWNTGYNETLSVEDCQGEDGTAMTAESFNFIITVAGNLIFVSDTGDDASSGLQSNQPVRTLHQASLLAAGCNPGEPCIIKMTEGTFPESEIAEFSNPVHIEGGYNADFSEINRTGRNTEIAADPGFNCAGRGTNLADSCPLLALESAAMNQVNTKISGLTLQAPETANNVCGIRTFNGGPLLRNITVRGASDTNPVSENSKGLLFVDAESFRLEYSTIHSGHCSGPSCRVTGMHVMNPQNNYEVLNSTVTAADEVVAGLSASIAIWAEFNNNQAEIRRSVITAGISEDLGAGIVATGTSGSINIDQNVILVRNTDEARSIVFSAPAGGSRIANNELRTLNSQQNTTIQCTESPDHLNIFQNTIGMAPGSLTDTTYGIDATNDCNMHVVNNLFHAVDSDATDKTCLRQAGLTGVTGDIRNNNFHGCESYIHQSTLGNDFADLDGSGNLLDTGFIPIPDNGYETGDNSDVDAVLNTTDHPLYQLTENTPCTVARDGYSGGDHALPAVDLRMRPRTTDNDDLEDGATTPPDNGYSKGAFEWDGPCN